MSWYFQIIEPRDVGSSLDIFRPQISQILMPIFITDIYSILLPSNYLKLYTTLKQLMTSLCHSDEPVLSLRFNIIKLYLVIECTNVPIVGILVYQLSLIIVIVIYHPRIMMSSALPQKRVNVLRIINYIIIKMSYQWRWW